VRSRRSDFTELCSGSEAGSYVWLIDFLYHSTLGLRVIKKKKIRRVWKGADLLVVWQQLLGGLRVDLIGGCAFRDGLCTGGLDVIRKEAWPFYRTISGVRLFWELEEPKGPKMRV